LPYPRVWDHLNGLGETCQLGFYMHQWWWGEGVLGLTQGEGDNTLTPAVLTIKHKMWGCN